MQRTLLTPQVKQPVSTTGGKGAEFCPKRCILAGELRRQRSKAKALSHELTPEDYGIEDTSLGDEETKKLVEAEVQDMIGMHAGKAFFSEIKDKVLYVEGGGDMKILQVCLNMRITGKPHSLLQDTRITTWKCVSS